ncbi:hypothetical protein GN316_09750 [Xylophilus sp. Kf1]|nr:hypothetical protein [Xylophilus sp. Kf1]
MSPVGRTATAPPVRADQPTRPSAADMASPTGHAALDLPRRPRPSNRQAFTLPAALPPPRSPAVLQADRVEAIGRFCIGAPERDAGALLQSVHDLQRQLGTQGAMTDIEPALARVFTAARTAALTHPPADSAIAGLRAATLALARAIDSRWVRLHPLPVQATGFPITGFGRPDADSRRRNGMRAFHKTSASAAAKVALASPSLAQVRRSNARHLAALHARQPGLAGLHGTDRWPAGVTPRDVVLAQCTPALLDRIRDQLLEHMDDAFLTNLRRNVRKAGGALWQRLSADDRELTRTRSQLVAEMLALDDPASALNRALEQLAPRMLQHRPLADMGALESADLVLRLATETMDGIFRPTPSEARRSADIVADLAVVGQRDFDRIHVEAMQRLQASAAGLPADASAETVHRLIDRETRRTSARIDSARQRLFDEFRRRNHGEFGYNTLSEQVRENTNVEYYKTLLLPSAVWAAGARLTGAAFTVIGGPVGVSLTVAAAAVLQYVTAVTAQASAGATGAASADLRPFDSASMPRPMLDPQIYWNQRHLSTAVQRIATEALQAYTRPGNPAAKACRSVVHRLESDLGYDLQARTALAPELFALAQYHDHMTGRDAGGLDQAVPAPIRIARLLHTFHHELPSLKNLAPGGSEMSEATRRTVVESIVAAIHRGSDTPPPADVATVATRARGHAADLLADSGLDRPAFAAFMAPDATAMHAGGVDFAALLDTLLPTAGLMEQGLFDSRGFLSAQYRGLYVNAVVGLAVQIAIGLGAFFGISAASAAGGPAAGFGAAVAFTALSFAAGSVSRDAGAVSWYRKDREAQTDSLVYRLMRSPDARPLVGDRDRHVAQIEQAIHANHGSLHKRRMDQLFFGLRAAWEAQLIHGSARQAQSGFDMLHALEQHPAEADQPRFAAELAGQSMDAMHEATSVRKHQALIDTHSASMKLVATAAAAAQQVLAQPSSTIRETAERYVEDRDAYGIRDAYRYRDRHIRFFPDADGVVPARVALDRLRLLAREAFERHIERHRGQAGFQVSAGELESLKTALRTPHADDGTELWLADLEWRLRDASLWSEGDRPHHLDVSALPAGQVDALRRRHTAGAQEIEERRRAMRIITNDMLALQAGRFDAIQDPLGIVGGSLAHFSDAGQFSRQYRVNHDLAFIAFTRGTARFAGQVVPVTFRGAAAALVVLAGGGLAIAQATDARTGAFTLEKLGAEDAQNLQAHGIELSALQSTGFQPRFGSLAGPLATGLMNAVQPQTNPATFQSSGQIQSFQAGFTVDDPSFDSLAGAGAQDRRHFETSASHWGDGLVSPDAVVAFLRTQAGATQLKLRIDRKLGKLPDARFLPRQDRIRWNTARDLSRRGWTARLGQFLPSRYWHDLTYAKNARHHFEQVQNDRHRLAASLVVAGHRLAAMGAPAEPPIASELDPHCVDFASAMLHALLQQPGAAEGLFVDRPPASVAEQHRVVMRAVLGNPWYLLRLVHFAMTRLDPADAEQQETRRNLDEFRKLLAEDVLRASLPLAVRKLEHAITLCAQRPMTADRLAELGADLRRSRADVQAMAPGPERQRLMGLVDDFAAGVAAVESVEF